ncbi:MAG: DeoR/GlpR transcriptional regulator [Firmicutes bacterium]|jgi:DeoR/GlpR family transcriptional regulator of sugar metabolism|nr:DeoR/GlpR transcriptional regulator [Bacillota bacterium]
MLPAERKSLIVETIAQQGSVTVDQLVTLTGVSGCTIRRDLDNLAAQGLVDRTHGGAVLPRTGTSYERLYPEKRSLHLKEKQRIGKAAAALVTDGETIILDSGSTTLEVARFLTNRKNLTIITNDLFIATEVQYDPTTLILVTGGILRPGFNVLQGSAAEAMIRSVNVDKAFIGGDAVDVIVGVTNATFAEASLKQLMLAAAREAYLVVDHTKFGKRALAQVAPLDRFTAILTDAGLAAEHRMALVGAQIRFETV